MRDRIVVKHDHASLRRRVARTTEVRIEFGIAWRLEIRAHFAHTAFIVDFPDLDALHRERASTDDSVVTHGDRSFIATHHDARELERPLLAIAEGVVPTPRAFQCVKCAFIADRICDSVGMLQGLLKRFSGEAFEGADRSQRRVRQPARAPRWASVVRRPHSAAPRCEGCVPRSRQVLR